MTDMIEKEDVDRYWNLVATCLHIYFDKTIDEAVRMAGEHRKRLEKANVGDVYLNREACYTAGGIDGQPDWELPEGERERYSELVEAAFRPPNKEGMLRNEVRWAKEGLERATKKLAESEKALSDFQKEKSE